MKRVVITGGNGVIGGVAQTVEADWQTSSVDLPSFDARDYAQVVREVASADVVIHLAWNRTEHHKSRTADFDNQRMAFNVYRACLQCGVHRVIMASSVHADSFWPPR